MKWFRRFFILILFMAVCVIAVIFFLQFSNDFQQKGELNIPGLTNRVTIQRDANGMAYIKAQNLEDVLFAQGFVTAQDRLFQMQLTRLFAQGRICELAGDAAKNLDIQIGRASCRERV